MNSGAYPIRLHCQLLQATYLGGSGLDAGKAIALDSKGGGVYVTGRTKSTDFPNVATGAQAAYGGGPCDGFVSRFSYDLKVLTRSTYLGGRIYDAGRAIDINPANGMLYVTGTTSSRNFPNTKGGTAENEFPP